LGYLLGNLFLKGIDPKHSQSKGIADLGPLGQELEQLEKPPNRDRFKGFLGQGYQPKRHKVLIRDTQQESCKKSSSKLCHKNHNKELRKSRKRRMGKATPILEEPRRIIYTYHEGSYKV
jgi:hypothetical protein